MPVKNPDYYTILGVLRQSSQEEIKRAYIEAAQRYHPDKNLAVGDTEVFLDIQQAYELLSNPKRRSQYDATLPPEIEPHPVLKHSLAFSRAGLADITEPQLMYALLTVGALSEAVKIPAPPLNLCLLLDRSTSMQGEKMDRVKSAAIQLIRNMRPQDKFSIVIFSDRADVLIQSALQPEVARQEAQIQLVQVSGSTEIYQGLLAGVNEIHRNFDSHRVNHLILLTDGHTYGDEQASLELADQLARENIGLTGMGIGNEWNDIFLDALASRTGGTSAYISDPKDIKRLLVDKFKALASVFASEVIFESKKPAGVIVKSIFRIQPEVGPVTLEEPLLLGPILQDQELRVLFEFVIHPAALESRSVTLIDGALKATVAGYPRPVPPLPLKFVCNVRTEESTEPPAQDVMHALARMMLYRMQERAQVEAQAGRFDNAARQLQNMATHLLAQGEYQLAKTALMEAEHLEQKHDWTNSGRKTLKYTTRALLMPELQEKME